MSSNDTERTIAYVRRSTRHLLESFKRRTDALHECKDDVNKLIRTGFDSQMSHKTAKEMFNDDTVYCLAIDGTESQDQQLDMIVFYAGAFGYLCRMQFSDHGCVAEDPLQSGAPISISAAIPVYEEDVSSVAGKSTEGGIEIDAPRLPSVLMHFSEYYMAIKVLMERPEVKVVILDRTLSGDMAHLLWSVTDLLEANSCILLGINTPYGKVSSIDLELVRMLHYNDQLSIPAPRSHFIKYAAIKTLFNEKEAIGFEELMRKVKADPDRLGKLMNDLTKLNERHNFLEQVFGCKVKEGLENYWQRVFSAVLKVAKNIFEPEEGKHPLRLEKDGKEYWITSDDIGYMTLTMVYALLRFAWERKILPIGLIKDTGAAELINTVVPVLRSAGKLKVKDLPAFRSDKMLLQMNSVINYKDVRAPWKSFEYDVCFKTVAPQHDELKRNQARVRGAFKNVISAERMFVKAYVQLWESESNPVVRSHVFSYDRPCYPEYDKYGDLELLHLDGKVEERIYPMMHFEQDSMVSHLVMDTLHSMAHEIIPEAVGHNYLLFLADKKAKSVLQGAREAYLSSVDYELTRSDLDQQVLFSNKFRDYRSEVESARRAKK
ncbi:MAG: hypothetical protein QXU32_12580 [Nitrososphaerales archaeon]